MRKAIINASSKDEKSTVGCCYNQPCLFNHSVIPHTIAELLLCDNPPVKIKETCTMNYDSTNPREMRGLEIAQRYTIRELNGFWLVPSVSGKGIKYKVDLAKQNCDCPDFELRQRKCKHLFAAESAFEREMLNSLLSDEIPQDLTLFATKKKHTQNWSAHNKSQTCEKSEFQKLLASLCKGVGEPTLPMKTKPRIAF